MVYKTSKRNIGLDIFRTFLVICIFLFHTRIHLKCDYGILNDFIGMGAVCMTGFFMLSGYVLAMNYHKIDFNEESLKTYFKKRFISIVPMYWLISLIYIIVYKNLRDNLVLLPIEILGLQSFFSSLFSFSHNSGTWFISCLMMCYFLHPFIQFFISKIKKKRIILFFILLVFISLYSSIIVWYFKLDSIYSNPFFRFFEFCIGIVLYNFKEDIENCKYNKILLNKITILFELLLLIIAVSIAIKLKIETSNNLYNFMLYNFIALPIFIFMIISFSEARFKYFNKVFEYFSKISYMFFLSQLFIFDLTKRVILFIGKDTNFLRISISLILCLLLSVILHKIESVIIMKSKKILKI